MLEERRQTIEHKGKQIIFHNYAGLERDMYAQAIRHNSAMVHEERQHDRLVLLDVSDTVVNKEVMKAYRQMTDGESKTIKRCAVLGLTGIQTLFIQAIASFAHIEIKPFKSKDDALEWLTS